MEAQRRIIIRKKVVQKRTGYSGVQIWRKSSDPNDDFPPPVQLGPNAIGWFEHEIDAWLDTRPRCYGIEAPAESEATDGFPDTPQTQEPAALCGHGHTKLSATATENADDDDQEGVQRPVRSDHHGQSRPPYGSLEKRRKPSPSRRRHPGEEDGEAEGAFSSTAEAEASR